MLYRTAKEYGSRREIKKTKKIQEKYSKKGHNSSSDSSSDDLDSDSLLVSDSSRDTYIRTSGRK